MTTTNRKPALTLRDGAIKATIWKNSGEKGTFYSVQFSRVYRNAEGKALDTNSFSGTALFKVARLAEKAYGQTAALREQDRMLAQKAESEA